MWKWFNNRGKFKKEIPQGNLTSFQETTHTTDFTNQDAHDAVKFYFYAVKPRLYYAQMQGFFDQPGDSNIMTNEDFLLSIMKDEKEITPSNEEFAFSKIILSIDNLFQNGANDQTRDKLKGHPHHEIFKRLEDKWPKGGLQALEETEKENLKSYIRKYVIFCKLADNIELSAKLIDKLEYMIPIFKSALAKGKNRYGDQSYSSYYEECRLFVAEYFSRESLKFYTPSDAWVEIAQFGITFVNE